MPRKSRVLLSKLVESMQRNDWTDDDIKDILGKNTINPKSFGLSSLYRVGEEYAFWLRVKKNGGLPKDRQALEELSTLIIGDKARRREQRTWRQEKIKIYKTSFVPKPTGPAKGIPTIQLQLSTCNLRCNHCQKPETWTEGNLVSLRSVDKLLKDNFEIPVLNLIGGEPLLWQNIVSIRMTLYKWCSDMTHQVHIETNGTVIPRKMMLDIFGLITIRPKLMDYGDEEYWKQTVRTWEKLNPPIWAPEISTRDDKLTNRIVKLFKDIDPERMWPVPQTISDNKFARNLAIDMGWKVNDCV